MSASLKESVPPPAGDLHLQEKTAGYSKRDEEYVSLLNTAGLACELDAQQLAAIASNVTEERIDSRRMDILELYYGGNEDASVASRRCASDRFFAHHDDFKVTAHQIVATLADLNSEIAPVKLQRIGTDGGPLVLRAGEHFSAVTDEEDESGESGTVAVRALVRAMNALLAKSGVDERLIPLVPDDARELYVGVTEEGAMTLLQGGCTEISVVQALREFASW